MYKSIVSQNRNKAIKLDINSDETLITITFDDRMMRSDYRQMEQENYGDNFKIEWECVESNNCITPSGSNPTCNPCKKYRYTVPLEKFVIMLRNMLKNLSKSYVKQYENIIPTDLLNELTNTIKNFDVCKFLENNRNRT